jgi:hypothetical protein
MASCINFVLVLECQLKYGCYAKIRSAIKLHTVVPFADELRQYIANMVTESSLHHCGVRSNRWFGTRRLMVEYEI